MFQNIAIKYLKQYKEKLKFVQHYREKATRSFSTHTCAGSDAIVYSVILYYS